MPNWVANKLVITGEDKYLNTIRTQMSAPYATHHYDIMTNSFSHGTTEGQFLLWNIVRPTNLDAYFEVEKHMKQAEERASAEPTEPLSADEIAEKLQEAINSTTALDLSEFAQKFQQDIEVGQDWYHWNIREWGTKWEVDEAVATQSSGELRYEFATAWSPPIPALNKLAAQYPNVVMTARFLDEGHCFAGEAHWRNGKLEFETDIDINHGLLEEMYGYCHNCSDGNENDPDYDEAREAMKCAEFNKPIEIEGVI